LRLLLLLRSYMSRWRRIKRRVSHPNLAKPLPIIHDAAIAAASIAEGRLVPVLIVDATVRPDVVTLVHAHDEPEQAGDAEFQWGRMQKSRRTVSLFVDFKRPVETFVILEFVIARQGILVDRILRSGSFYLQLGETGDNLVDNVEAPRILVSVPEIGFSERWEKLFHAELARELHSRGCRRRDAKRKAREVIKHTRETLDMRVTS
jgi:hypothetical protein